MNGQSTNNNGSMNGQSTTSMTTSQTNRYEICIHTTMFLIYDYAFVNIGFSHPVILFRPQQLERELCCYAHAYKPSYKPSYT